MRISKISGHFAQGPQKKIADKMANEILKLFIVHLYFSTDTMVGGGGGNRPPTVNIIKESNKC